MIHYPMPPHLQQAYSSLELAAKAFPMAEELAATCLSLPMWPGMTEEHVSDIARAIHAFYSTTSV